MIREIRGDNFVTRMRNARKTFALIHEICVQKTNNVLVAKTNTD